MRSSLLYLLLVGAPLLGLLAILTAGEQLVPPHAIGGAWTIEGSGSPCVLAVNREGVTEMSVAQSGPRAEATFSDEAETRLSLNLIGDSVTGIGEAAPGSGCAGDTLALNGKLRITDATTRITGTLSRAGCPTCAAMDFSATRLPPGGE